VRSSLFDPPELKSVFPFSSAHYPQSGLSALVARYQGCFLLGKIAGDFEVSTVSTRRATFAANSISLSNSQLLFFASILADHFAVRIATMRHVAIRSDGPIFGQSGTSLYPPISIIRG
jgi:hypothetical protein